MIVEFWQGQGNLFSGLSVVARTFYTAGALGGAGVALFLVVMSDRLTAEETRAARRALVILVALGLVASLAALPLQAVALARGPEGIWRLELYQAILRSRMGDAFLLRGAGLVLVMCALVRTTWGAAFASVGAVMVAASYAGMGHSTSYRPRQELAALVTLHVAAVSFWFGSLFALRPITRRRDPRSAAAAIQNWSRAATLAMAMMIGAGGLLTAYLVVTASNMVNAWHGRALIAKLALFVLVLAMIAMNRFRHTRLMARGDIMASGALDRSIRAEIIVALLIIYAAAEMTSVHPIDMGHRIPN